MKKFHIGDVLSIMTLYLVSPRGIDGVYDILGYMTGESLFTHQLPRAAKECRPFLAKQFPQLVEVDTTGVNPKNHEAKLAEWVAKFGEEFEVEPIPATAHEVKDPFDEAAEIMGSPDKVIAVIVE